MRKQQREITNHKREFQNNAITEVKQISLSHVIRHDNNITSIAPEIIRRQCGNRSFFNSPKFA